MKCNQSSPGFELSPCPFPTTITISPRHLPFYRSFPSLSIIFTISFPFPHILLPFLSTISPLFLSFVALFSPSIIPPTATAFLSCFPLFLPSVSSPFLSNFFLTFLSSPFLSLKCFPPFLFIQFSSFFFYFSHILSSLQLFLYLCTCQTVLISKLQSNSWFSLPCYVSLTALLISDSASQITLKNKLLLIFGRPELAMNSRNSFRKKQQNGRIPSASTDCLSFKC